MPVGGKVPWPIVEHTAAKHEIYRRYLHRWFPIVLSDKAWRSACYVEGFAGPGVYSGGEPGSPIVAIKAFIDEVSDPSRVGRFIFVDDDDRCVKMLKEQLNAVFPGRPRSEDVMPVRIIQGTCADVMEPALDDAGAWGSPIFANLDSWGNAPVPYSLLKRLASHKASEVMVTLQPQHFVRFVTRLGAGADDVFGGDDTWRQTEHIDSTAKRRHILQCYRNALMSAGFEYLLDFELVDRRGDALYLVFGTNHRRGLEKMKDSMWEVDRVFGVGYRDPRDSQAETLFEAEDAQLGALTRLLEARLSAVGRARVHDLREFVLFNTVFRREHVIKALKPLIDRGLLHIEDGSQQIRIGSYVSLSSTK